MNSFLCSDVIGNIDIISSILSILRVTSGNYGDNKHEANKLTNISIKQFVTLVRVQSFQLSSFSIKTVIILLYFIVALVQVLRECKIMITRHLININIDANVPHSLFF